jgi:HD-GYP domain-containing protein (c-di-GMP phosphodiesterase class II)
VIEMKIYRYRVCYLAGKLLKTIRDRQPDEEISDKDILCVEIAGLCHDLGKIGIKYL